MLAAERVMRGIENRKIGKLGDVAASGHSINDAMNKRRLLLDLGHQIGLFPAPIEG